MLTQEVAKFDFSFNDRLFPSGTTGRTEVGRKRGGTALALFYCLMYASLLVLSKIFSPPYATLTSRLHTVHRAYVGRFLGTVAQVNLFDWG